MQVNPMQLIQMIRNGSNPQQLMLNILQQQMGSTPMGQNLLSIVESGRQGDLESFARNICKARGVDFDSEFAAFRKELGF